MADKKPTEAVERKPGGLVTVRLPITITTAQGDVPPGEPVDLPEDEARALVARFGELPKPQPAYKPKPVAQSTAQPGRKPDANNA